MIIRCCDGATRYNNGIQDVYIPPFTRNFARKWWKFNTINDLLTT